MKNLFTTIALLPLALAAYAGIIVNTGTEDVDITWYTPSSVRVVKTPSGSPADINSLSIIAKPQDVKVKSKETESALTLSSSELTVKIDKTNGTVTYTDKRGNVLLQENGAGSLTPRDDAGRKTYSPSQSFALDDSEAIYGLGILQNGQMSQRGVDRVLTTGNTEDGIPFFLSSKGYGVYWDNYSATRFADVQGIATFSSEVGDAIDYYFMYGKNADGVISEVRQLTGDVPMVPLWTYGFHQSKERYKSQDETVGVLHRYRNDNIPLDGIIQDWQYWGNNYLWNAMEFMSESFPEPQKMLDDIHDNNAHCIISIWSSFGPKTKPYKELDEKGLLFDIKTWPESGISHIWPPRMDYPSGVRVYDCYSSDARDIYWNNLRRIYDLGMDAWWMDSTEPDHFDKSEADMDHQTALGSFRSVQLAYPLMTVGGVYDHQRAVSDSTRVFILTRSGAFGQQRYGANVWSGDVVSTWDMLRRQIPAGLNFSLTGNPNFNSDLGGFFAGSYNGSWQGKPATENPAYHELYVRWTQYGVFTPMMRSHGADVPREIYLYGKPGEPIYDALVDAVKLRYRLQPYIYSTANEVSRNRDTFMRALVMDFPTDPQALDCNDKYMFGRSLLVAPVISAYYTPEVIRRDKDENAGWDKNTGRTTLTVNDNIDFLAKHDHEVYLPKGADWYLFDNDEKYKGGQTVTLQVNIQDIPFFVKAGSILPIGPDVQYTGQKPWDELQLMVYPGADGSFTLYEDEGNNYNYEKGAYTEIPMNWNDRSRTLTIGARTGAYDGMIDERTFHVTLPDGTSKAVKYDGKKVSVKL